MPGMNGVQLLQRIKNINPSVTRMLISAFEVQDEIFRGCDCVDKFLQKPIKMSEIISEVRKQMNSIRIQNEG
jgi:response regulator RpfG family c-di-GMP phosphodiesterase